MAARVCATPCVVILDEHTPTLKLLCSWSAPKRGAARAGGVSQLVRLVRNEHVLCYVQRLTPPLLPPPLTRAL